MRGFGSDNHSGVHPRFLDAITKANTGHAPSYGTDSWSTQALAIIREHFGPEAEAFFVFNGTAANVLSFSSLISSHHTIIASQYAHLVNDECGAPERALGCKVVSVATGNDAKLTIELIRPHLMRRGDQHYSQVRAISITQPTEVGTVYTPEEIRALSRFAKENHLFLHMDGARLVNAAAFLKTSLASITSECGVDALSLGGTKNGLLFGEAVVFLRAGLAGDFKYQRKQLMQLPSKTRFISAQFIEFLGTDLWLKNAEHANEMAARLYRGLISLPQEIADQITVRCSPQSNAVFTRFPKTWISQLKESAFFYIWDEHSFECRLMTTWDTKTEDVDDFIAAIHSVHRLNR